MARQPSARRATRASAASAAAAPSSSTGKRTKRSVQKQTESQAAEEPRFTTAPFAEADNDSMSEHSGADSGSDDEYDAPEDVAFAKLVQEEVQADMADEAVSQSEGSGVEDSDSDASGASSALTDSEASESEEGDDGSDAGEDAGEAADSAEPAELVVRAGHGGVTATATQLAMHVDDLESDDEAAGNTAGNVPMEWYDEFDHMGYNLAGKKIGKVEEGDAVDRFLNMQENEDAAWTIVDERTGEKYTMTARDVAIARNLQTGRFAHPEFVEHEDALDIYSADKEIMPLRAEPEPKRRFLPSKWEMRKVTKIARLMREGKYTAHKTKKEPEPEVFLMWDQDGEAIGGGGRKGPVHIAAPKPRLPGHAASYNPPAEYLFTEEERAAWEATPASKRPIDFIPHKYSALRHVPLYQQNLRERFERCLDLYLVPRGIKQKLRVDPDSLLPQLPPPSQLRPFPNQMARTWGPLSGRVRDLSCSPCGRWLAAGTDAGEISIWETWTARRVRAFSVGKIVAAVAWCPNPAVHVIAAAVDNRMVLLYPGTAVKPEHCAATRAALAGADSLHDLEELPEQAMYATALRPVTDEASDAGEADMQDAAEEALGGEDAADQGDAAAAVQWTQATELPAAEQLRGASAAGVYLSVAHQAQLRRVTWHVKGDYVATVAPKAASGVVLIHQLSKRTTLKPFTKNRGNVQLVQFHPSKPLLFVAAQRGVRVYNLVTAALEKKLSVGSAKWLSSMSIHPSGDHILAGSYDSRVVWLDWELSASPYKTLRYHTAAVRQVGFHPKYPLMATAADDGHVHIFHARVYSDLDTNPLLVPVKVLRAHPPSEEGFGVLAATWHPTQPWLFTAGSDRTIAMWQNCP